MEKGKLGCRRVMQEQEPCQQEHFHKKVSKGFRGDKPTCTMFLIFASTSTYFFLFLNKG